VQAAGHGFDEIAGCLGVTEEDTQGLTAVHDGAPMLNANALSCPARR
jgi:hypothetical protein